MTKKIVKTVGEGGAHAHRISSNLIETSKDGLHKHLFYINDRLLMSDLSGAHVHPIKPQANVVLPETEKHKHSITVNTEEGPMVFPVEEGESHEHELQSETTTLSGVHRHMVELMETNFISLVPGDLISEILEATDSQKLKNDIEKSEDPMEINFGLVKSLNGFRFQDIVKKAVETSIIKRMASLGGGLRIESLILSKERFADVGYATRFVLDQGLDIESSQVLLNEGVFTFQVMPRNAFEETTLQRIRITEGVDAVIGFLAEIEDQEEGVVVQNADVEINEESKELQSKENHVKIENTEKGSGMESLKAKFAKTMDSYEMTSKKEDAKAEPKKEEVTETSKSFKTGFEIVSKNEDQRLVTGPVLIPENIDLQDDIVSPEEIGKAAHGYMIKLAFRDDKEFLKDLGFINVDQAGERGFMHTDFSRKAAVVETFIAPVDFELNGRTITKGTWVMTMKIFDDEIWSLVKAGRIAGFSIGGRSKSRPEND